MGIESIGKIVSSVGKTQLSKGVELVSTPAISKTVKGNFKLATEFVSDTFFCSNADKSLSPRLLRSLTEINGEPIDIAVKIKDAMLKAMGYKQPYRLTTAVVQGTDTSNFIPIDGSIEICSKFLENKAGFIASIRHELDHMDKFVKLYKSLGEDEFINMLVKKQKFYHPNTPIKQIREDVCSTFNAKFYREMSKDVDITNFDTQKYYNAVIRHRGFGHSFNDNYHYFNNELEKSAYLVEKLVKQALGISPRTAKDNFPKNYETLVELMNTRNMTAEQQEISLSFLRLVCAIKDSSIIKSYARVLQKINNHQELSKTDINIVKRTLRIFSDFIKKADEKVLQDVYKEVENMMRNGIYTIEDVLRNI